MFTFRNPNIPNKVATEQSLRSTVTADNSALWKAMEEVFNLRENEMLTGLRFTDGKVIAFFSKTNQ